MSKELDRRLMRWKEHPVGQLYKRCSGPPPVVVHRIMAEYIDELERALETERAMPAPAWQKKGSQS